MNRLLVIMSRSRSRFRLLPRKGEMVRRSVALVSSHAQGLGLSHTPFAWRQETSRD